MLTIRLFCNEGMSTSLLVEEMKKAAAAEGTEVDIRAYPINDLDDKAKGIDCALLGPQVGYLKAKASKTCQQLGVPMDVISNAGLRYVQRKKCTCFCEKISRKIGNKER